MGDVVDFRSNDTTADDALDDADLIDWQDIIILGFDQSGNMQVKSSSIEVAVAIMLLESLKLQLLTNTDRHFDA